MITGDHSLLLVMACILGLVLGSFVTAAAWRLPRDIWLGGRSACPACGTPLGVRDLLPVLSFLLMRGRCRHCQSRISWRYLLTELTTAALWVTTFCLLPGLPLAALIVSLLGTLLLLAALIDWDHYYLPDSLTLGSAGLALMAMLSGLLDPMEAVVGAALIGGLALGLRVVMSWWMGRTALGLGDVKLMAMAGLWLGPAGLSPFLLMSGLGGLGLALLRRVLARSGHPETQIPFGPALALALYLLLLYRWRLAPPPAPFPLF